MEYLIGDAVVSKGWLPAVEEPLMLNDFRYAFRTLRQNPGFALTAILSIALAIGANSAIFSYADGLLLRPLPVEKPSEIVTLGSISPSMSSMPLRGVGSVSYPQKALRQD